MGDGIQRWRAALNGLRGHALLAGLLATLAMLVSGPLWRSAPTVPPLMPPAATNAAPQPPMPMPALPDAAVLNVVVRRSDTLEQIFRAAGLDLADLAAIRALDGARTLVDRLARGELLTIRHRDGDVLDLQRNLSLTERLHVVRDEADTFHFTIEKRPVEVVQTVAFGRIESSLFDAADDAGLQDPTVLKLARLFGWDIDFALDLRSGDEFTVDFERLYQDGHFVQDGEILAARFVNDGHEYRAVRYRHTDGSSGYYTPEGRTLEKAFLRAPLEFRRVSSGFSRGRYHPILNRIRAHKGVDYAAAAGTPVYAAGSGRVQFRGQKGGYGNMIEIDHGGGIVTAYGHLSRFAETARAGARVQQGQTIGFVGMTGLATGPHLHYEYRINGQFRDPQRVKLPEAEPIDASLLEDFRRQTAPLLAALDRPANGAAAAR
jgi:murein DD-endopeptidase MepM/ murein hydrolase activator NlpD